MKLQFSKPVHQRVDIFTKTLGKERFQKFRALLGMKQNIFSLWGSFGNNEKFNGA